MFWCKLPYSAFSKISGFSSYLSISSLNKDVLIIIIIFLVYMYPIKEIFMLICKPKRYLIVQLDN